MRPAAADPLDGTAIGRQLRLLGVEARERFIAECKQLARGERARAGERDGKAQRLAAQVLIKAVRGILVRLAVGVAVEPADADIQLIVEPEIGQQRLRALTEAAPIGSDCFGIGLERLVLGPPRLVRGENNLRRGKFLVPIMCKKAAARKPFLAHVAANFVFAYRSPAVNRIPSP